MKNGIKFSDAESGALRIGGANLAPKNESVADPGSYWTSIEPPAGGYTIYLNKSENGPSIYVAENDTQLISLTNAISGSSYTTAEECFAYFNGQSDKTCFNREYEGIVTDGLVLNFDAGFIPSYPRSGTIWEDISGNGNNGNLTNGPTFDSDNGGSIVFDGVNDYVISNTPSILNLSQPTTLNIWFYFNSFSPENPRLIECRDSSNSIQLIRDASTNKIATKNSNFELGNLGIAWVTITTGVWYNISVLWVPSLTTTILYLNGISQSGSTFNNIAPGNQTNKIVMGARSDFQGTTWMNGRVSNLQIYNRALSASEVLKNYQATYTRFFGDKVVTSGLILHLDAGYAESYPGSGTTWKDISGNGNDVTLYNGISYQDGALVGDGVNDYGRTTNTLNLSGLTAITIVVICKVPTTTQKAIYEHTNNWNSIIVYDNVRYGGFGFFINSNGFNSLENSGHFQLNGNIGYSGSNAQLPTTSNYQQYTTIHDFSKSLNVSAYAEETTVYTNGSKSTQTASGGQNNTQTFVDDYLYLWSRGGSSFNSQASISQLLIYNRALTEAEITQNYNASKSRYGL